MWDEVEWPLCPKPLLRRSSVDRLAPNLDFAPSISAKYQGVDDQKSCHQLRFWHHAIYIGVCRSLQLTIDLRKVCTTFWRQLLSFFARLHSFPVRNQNSWLNHITWIPLNVKLIVSPAGATYAFLCTLTVCWPSWEGWMLFPCCSWTVNIVGLETLPLSLGSITKILTDVQVLGNFFLTYPSQSDDITMSRQNSSSNRGCEIFIQIWPGCVNSIEEPMWFVIIEC